jgi:hypothetical protein
MFVNGILRRLDLAGSKIGSRKIEIGDPLRGPQFVCSTTWQIETFASIDCLATPGAARSIKIRHSYADATCPNLNVEIAGWLLAVQELRQIQKRTLKVFI